MYSDSVIKCVPENKSHINNKYPSHGIEPFRAFSEEFTELFEIRKEKRLFGGMNKTFDSFMAIYLFLYGYMLQLMLIFSVVVIRSE